MHHGVPIATCDLCPDQGHETKDCPNLAKFIQNSKRTADELESYKANLDHVISQVWDLRIQRAELNDTVETKTKEANFLRERIEGFVRLNLEKQAKMNSMQGELCAAQARIIELLDAVNLQEAQLFEQAQAIKEFKKESKKAIKKKKNRKVKSQPQVAQESDDEYQDCNPWTLKVFQNFKISQIDLMCIRPLSLIC